MKTNEKRYFVIHGDFSNNDGLLFRKFENHTDALDYITEQSRDHRHVNNGHFTLIEGRELHFTISRDVKVEVEEPLHVHQLPMRVITSEEFQSKKSYYMEESKKGPIALKYDGQIGMVIGGPVDINCDVCCGRDK